MENTIAFKLLNSRFEEHRHLAKSTVFCNFLLASIFLIANPNSLWDNLHVQLCLLSGIFILGLLVFYTWKNTLLNLLIVLIYLGLFIVELIMVGIPENPMTLDQNMGKGLLLGLLMALVPALYMGLRIIFVLPLIQVSLSSFKLKKRSKI